MCEKACGVGLRKKGGALPTGTGGRARKRQASGMDVLGATVH